MKIGALVLIVACSLRAQPAGGGGAAVDVTFSSTETGDLERNGKVGEVGIDHYGFRAVTPVSIGPDLRLMVGAAWSRDDLELTGAAPLPQRLESFSLNFGLTTQLSQKWRMMTMVRPGIAGESLTAKSETFQVGALWSFEREVSPTFKWSVGVAMQNRGHYRVLPALGLRWNATPELTVTLGAPKTGLVYSLTQSLRLNVGLGMQGGTYYVGNSRQAGLRDTYLDYREFRVGAGMEFDLGRQMVVSAELGRVVSRRFDYFDRDYRLDGDATNYLELGFRFRL